MTDNSVEKELVLKRYRRNRIAGITSVVCIAFAGLSFLLGIITLIGCEASQSPEQQQRIVAAEACALQVPDYNTYVVGGSNYITLSPQYACILAQEQLWTPTSTPTLNVPLSHPVTSTQLADVNFIPTLTP